MNYLDNVPKDKTFKLGDKSIRNLKELSSNLRELNEQSFTHYVGADYNYFADWVVFVVGHKQLATALRKVQSKKEALEVLEKEVSVLEKPKELHKPKVEKEIPKEKPKEEKKKVKHIKKKAAKSHKKPEKPEEDLELKPPPSFIVSDNEPKPIVGETKLEETEEIIKEELEEDHKLLTGVAKDEKQLKEFLWKHFAWDMAKEFMYGMALGIIIGLVLSKIFFRV